MFLLILVLEVCNLQVLLLQDQGIGLGWFCVLSVGENEFLSRKAKAGDCKLFKTNDEIESEKLEKGVRDSILEIVRKREEKVITGGKDSFGSDFLGLLVKAYHDARRFTSLDKKPLILCLLGLSFIWHTTRIGNWKQEKRSYEYLANKLQTLMALPNLKQ
ncbi:hypothetical protein ACE6H2_016489 [Prunus campanulata]